MRPAREPAAPHASTVPRRSSGARGVPARELRVIEGWSAALRAGRVSGAAAYFAVPSEFFDGGDDPVQLRTRGQVVAANAELACGARLIAVRRLGAYVNALFRLADRPGTGGAAGCGAGAGHTARTNFLIGSGRILKWLRAPDQPGDDPAPPQEPAAPGTGRPV
jgi:hypothetical protein